MALLLFTGLYLTIRVKLGLSGSAARAIRYIFEKEEGKGDVSALPLHSAGGHHRNRKHCRGVATALLAGGPARCSGCGCSRTPWNGYEICGRPPAVRFRTVDENGQIAGGPMYYIERGMGSRWIWLAKVFAFFGVVTALLGCGTFPQVNAITESVESAFGVPVWLMGADHYAGRDGGDPGGIGLSPSSGGAGALYGDRLCAGSAGGAGCEL